MRVSVIALLYGLATICPACGVAAQDIDWKAGRLGHLSSLIGTYDFEDRLLGDPVVAAGVAACAPAVTPEVLARNLEVRGPIDFIDGHLVLSGLRAHHGGEEEAALWVKVYDGSVRVFLLHDGERRLCAADATYGWIPLGLRQRAVSRPEAFAAPPDDLVWQQPAGGGD